MQMFYLLTTMQQYLVRNALGSQVSNMCSRVQGATVLIILKSMCYFILLRIVHELLVLMSPRSMVYLELYSFSIVEATERRTKRPSCFLTILPSATMAGSNVHCLSFRRKCRPQFIPSGRWRRTSRYQQSVESFLSCLMR